MTADRTDLVCNTGPLIAVAAACGDWSPFARLNRRILVPRTVWDELHRGRPGTPGRTLPLEGSGLELWDEHVPVPAYIRNSLDPGESAVIATALAHGITMVAIDEQAGRRTARACGLTVTGTWGILLRARSLGHPVDIPIAIQRIRLAGIWVSDALADQVLGLLRGGDATRP
ncbi:MAG: hypothetical protein RLZZ127_1753 [Planctomycetota bacterium]|jgi:predicted nucleic acid-binding protein